jgi:hypothetical protein
MIAMIATIRARQSPPVALVVLGSDATTRRTDAGHPQRQELAMRTTLGAEAKAATLDDFATLRGAVERLSTDISAILAANHLLEQQQTGCAHDDPRERRSLGVYASTAGPDRLAVDQCLLCGDPVVVAIVTPNGGARAVGERAGQLRLQQAG